MRALDVEDYIDILRRHKSLILAPMLAGLVISVVVAFLWPDTYVSTATIRIMPPQVPEGILSMPMTVDMSQRVNQMTQSILSRGTLQSIINTYSLYPRERKRLPMEDIIESMRTKSIKVDLIGNSAGGQTKTLAFTVSFKYEKRDIAQRVCQDLVTKFIDENVRERASSSIQMKDFVEDQWAARKRDLDSIEEQLSRFKSANVGRTPEQQGATISAINGIETRMTNINASLARVNQDRLIMENQISILRDQLKQVSTPTTTSVASSVPKSERLLFLDREIANGETRLQSLREQYQESHPDIRTATGNLAILRKERDKLQKQQDDAEEAARKSGSITSLRPEAQREARVLEAQISQFQSRIEASKIEEESYKKALVDAERSARNLQGTLATMPASEKEYEQLRLQAMLARRDFEEIDRMRQRANAAVELENRKQTEKLEILDQASLPQTPTEPKRWIIILGGTIAGLVLGVCFAGAKEMKDSTLKNLKDVRAYTQLTVLGCIPLLENDLVVRRRRRLTWLAWSTACIAGVAIMAGSVIFYMTSK